MPFGIKSAPEIFQQRISQALEGLKGTCVIADDILVYGEGDSDEEALLDHDNNLEKVFERCLEKNIKINK